MSILQVGIFMLTKISLNKPICILHHNEVTIRTVVSAKFEDPLFGSNRQRPMRRPAIWKSLGGRSIIKRSKLLNSTFEFAAKDIEYYIDYCFSEFICPMV